MGKKYGILNWSKYNHYLIGRYDLSIWFSEDEAKHWYAPKRKKRGRPYRFSDQCIELLLTLRSLFQLPLRGVQGFARGLLKLCGLEHLEVPNFSVLSRRAKSLGVVVKVKPGQKITDIAIDSTGLKIYGEGEWKMRTHGKQGRRTWRKLHLVTCLQSHQILAAKLTIAGEHDDRVAPELFGQLPSAESVYGDGAYLWTETFDAIAKLGARAVIPLRGGTSLIRNPVTAGERERNRLVREIWRYQGRLRWKKKTDYHKRSLVETQMYRYKGTFGGKLRSRALGNQQTEALLQVKILNKMTSLGMPQSYIR